MAQRRGFPLRTQVRTRRKTAWGVGPNSNTITITAPNSPKLWSNGVILLNDAENTIVRTRGVVHVILSASSLAHGGFSGAVAIGIGTSAAFGAGVASLPSAIAESDWDGWLWHSFFDVRTITATIADGSNAASVSHRFEVDSKAMRKLTDDMTVFGSIEMRTEAGVATAIMDADTRMLFKLP